MSERVEEPDGRPSEPLSASQRSYRDHLVSARQKAYEDYDKALLTLSSGALALSIAFVKDFVGDGILTALWLLTIAWAAWSFSIVITLVSFRLSQGALTTAIDAVDASEDQSRREVTKLAGQVEKANLASGILFVVGVVLLVVFATLNISNRHAEKEASKGEADGARGSSGNIHKQDITRQNDDGKGLPQTPGNSRIPASATTKEVKKTP